jgi:plasmid stability protein
VSGTGRKRKARLTVRGVDPEISRRLKVRAAEQGRSAEAEHRAILERVLGSGADDFWAEAARLREQTGGRRHTDSELAGRVVLLDELDPRGERHWPRGAKCG